MDDAQQQRVKDALASVLAEFADVSWESEFLRDNAIEFFMHGKRVSLPFDQAELDARAALRDKLRQLGAVESNASQARDKDVEPAVTRPEADAPPKPVYGREEGYKVFRSCRVIGIELDRDLMIPKGNVLIIPLNRPNTFLDMPSEQYHILFDTTSEVIHPEAPVDEPTMSLPAEAAFEDDLDEIPAEPEHQPLFSERNEIDDILAVLARRNGAVKPRVIAEALNTTIKSVEGHLRRLQDRGAVVMVQPGFWTLPSKGSPTVRPRPLQDGKRSRLGVSPQAGRILLCMAYATKVGGGPDLLSAQVTLYLSERDARQYGARIPGMMVDGLVERGAPLPGVRGWHYRLTEKGLNISQQLGTWPYDFEGESPPDWIDQLAGHWWAGKEFAPSQN